MSDKTDEKIDKLGKTVNQLSEKMDQFTDIMIEGFNKLAIRMDRMVKKMDHRDELRKINRIVSFIH